MVQFQVSTNSLGYTGAAMSSALAQFDAHVAQVTATVSGVVGVSWTGRASDEFQAAWDQWLAQAQITRAALTGIVGALGVAEGTYEATESGLVKANKDVTVSVTTTGSGRATTGGTK